MSQQAFRSSIDPGWLFVITGLVLGVCCIRFPAEQERARLEQRVADLRLDERQSYSRLTAHERFLNQLEAQDPALLQRVTVSQLNVIPRGDQPVLAAPTLHAPMIDWIEASMLPSEPMDSTTVRPPTDSRLSRLATGPHRIWVLGSAAMCVFIGLIIDPALARNRIV